MKTQNTIQKAINYLTIYLDKNDNFDDFKYISKCINNPLQTAYIKQEKINSLLEYTDTKIKGTTEQRKKYFTSTSISKLLNKMFKAEKAKEVERINTISDDIHSQLRKEYLQNIEFFICDDVGGFYSEENKSFIYNKNGSCMSGKPKQFFDIYDKFINTKVQIVGLKVGMSVVARALFWSKEITKDIICEESGKIIGATKEKKYFLDRIYVSNEFQNSCFESLQLQLFSYIKRSYKLDNLNCFNKSNINIFLRDCYGDKAKIKSNNCNPDFSIQINEDTFHELESYPYLDTFRWGENLSQNIKFEATENDYNFVLDSTEGEYTNDEERAICDCCGERFHEDDVYYSELEEEYLCNDCGVYIEERGESVRREHAVYNEYSGDYHYCIDLGI
jgi:hypothetical protein